MVSRIDIYNVRDIESVSEKNIHIIPPHALGH